MWNNSNKLWFEQTLCLFQTTRNFSKHFCNIQNNVGSGKSTTNNYVILVEVGPSKNINEELQIAKLNMKSERRKLYPLNSAQKPITTRIAQRDNKTLNNIVNFFKILFLVFVLCHPQSPTFEFWGTSLRDAGGVNVYIYFIILQFKPSNFSFISSPVTQFHSRVCVQKMAPPLRNRSMQNWQCCSSCKVFVRIHSAVGV